MRLRDRIFSLAVFSFLIFSPLSSVVDFKSIGDSEYEYADEWPENLGPEKLEVKNLEAPPPWTCADATGTKYSFPNFDTDKCAPRSITWDVGIQFPSEDLTGTTFQFLFQWKY
ncbi:MAG TPA: hypothetical protein ENJ39_05950, partial [Flammeovirgaceae bacterium]|nr:hypothetical protein [Flammeovirgaceae bacterium]